MTTTKKNLAVGYISKAQAIERLELNFPVSAGADNSKERYRYMQALADVQAIRELPSVTPIRAKGHWITKPHVYGVTYCSECDFELKIDNTNYCPNCGAKMESEEI